MAIQIRRSTGEKRRFLASNGQRSTVTANWMVSIAALLVVLVVPVKPSTAALSSINDARQKDERALLNWATHLSRYSTDSNLPQIRYEPQDFFVEHACNGREDCRVLGWYNDRDIIYIEESLSAMDSLFERSLLVHEFVHVLQHRSGDFDAHDCEKFVEREREAYAVQQAFFVAHGAVPTIRARHYSCTASTIIANATDNSANDEFDDASQTARSQQAFINKGDRAEISVANPL